MTFASPITVTGLDSEDNQLLNECIQVWNDNKYRNNLLKAYYDSEQFTRDLGISIPPSIHKTKAVLDWPATAVEALVNKHKFEGYSLSGSVDPFEAGEILERNHFEVELLQAMSAAYEYGVSFITTGLGDTSKGEPPVVVQVRDALNMTAVYDSRTRSLSAAMALIEMDNNHQPIELRLYLRGKTLQLIKNRSGWRVGENYGGIPGRVLAEPLVYRPRVGKPFGRSRITKTIRYKTDAAIRTMTRTEISAEFFTSPQRYLLGVEEDAFADSRWSAMMGRIMAIGTNEEGEIPTVGQFSQMSMSPHLEQYRQLALDFCSSAKLPPTQVGIFTDNPSSSEAMHAAEEHLTQEAEMQWKFFRPHLKRVYENIVMLRDGLNEPPAEAWKINVNWEPARYVSPGSSSNWAVQAVQADPSLQGSPIILRRLGLSQGEIDEHNSWKRRGQAPDNLARLISGLMDAEEVDDGQNNAGGSQPTDGGDREADEESSPDGR